VVLIVIYITPYLYMLMVWTVYIYLTALLGVIRSY